MKNQINKDKNKRNLYSKSENKYIILKSIFKNTNIIKTTRWNSGLKFPSGNYKTSLVKRCVLTGRKNKINESFRFSRLSFLKLVRNGFIPGFKKSGK